MSLPIELFVIAAISAFGSVIAAAIKLLTDRSRLSVKDLKTAELVYRKKQQEYQVARAALLKLFEDQVVSDSQNVKIIVRVDDKPAQEMDFTADSDKVIRLLNTFTEEANAMEEESTVLPA